jgi:hypothetical protein
MIQRDKRPLGSLVVHMEKCIFIGYPQGYKGWKFYNPETKKVLISERADFDEHFFMLQKHSIPHLPPPHSDSLLETSSPPFVHLPENLDDSIDDLGDPGSSQKPVHRGDGSTVSDLPSVRPGTPPSSPSIHHPSPSPPRPIPSPAASTIPAPSHTPPPAPSAPPSRPQRQKRPRSE